MEVGGFALILSFSENVHGRLIQHRESVQIFKPLKCGSTFQNWNFGQMKIAVPQEGKVGDAYMLYTGIEGSMAKELKTLFDHAFVRFYIITILSTHSE